MLRPNQGKFVLALLALLVCTRVYAAQATAQVVLKTRASKEIRVQVELATTPAQWEKGLMNRKRLGEKAGMLFIFHDDQIRTFWMKNTKIPLDMIFLDRELRVVGIVESAVPETLTPRYVKAPSRYVLEVNGGFSQKHGIMAGDVARLSGVP